MAPVLAQTVRLVPTRLALGAKALMLAAVQMVQKLAVVAMAQRPAEATGAHWVPAALGQSSSQPAAK
jgi:hypothetical protein